MKNFLLWIALAIPSLSLSQSQSSQSHPNIVYILADDLGIGDVHTYNENGKIATPNMDRLAAAGMKFTDAHSSSAVCTPSRYSILTGRYAWRSRLQKGVLGGFSAPLLDSSTLTVPELLKKAHYQTAIIGKWHLGMQWPGTDEQHIDFSQPIRLTPLSYGFDYYYGISASLDMPPYVYIENNHTIELPVDSVSASSETHVRKGPKGPSFVFNETLATLTGKAKAYISGHKNEPFFLYFALPSPHTPLVTGSAFQGKSGICDYADYVMETDWVLGEVMKVLEAQGLSENTLIVFTSDNGYAPYAEYEKLKAAGHEPSYIYRGAKADIYEGGHRVPLIVSWPSTVKAGTTSDATVCLSDLMATCAIITGQTLAVEAGGDSYSWLPLLTGKPKQYKRTVTIHHSIDGNFAIRKGAWKLALTPGSGGWSEPRTALARKEGLPEMQLFHLPTDPGEKNNVAAANPQIVKELEDLLKRKIADGRSTSGPMLANDVPVDIYKSVK
ncbi:arylsulfatase [Chitinophaga sp. sic0106]|uniref:sulfatase family protein n=1 Tax=Chitinophaga sp. sic0106 TaxID=2854785 RepID=UPI001C45C65A|nr:arylsulfatase [Chitinophaga sp. sic0106]MBV7532293.1 arylsulfatase [Chitinophaga sp. sic0106]